MNSTISKGMLVASLAIASSTYAMSPDIHPYGEALPSSKDTALVVTIGPDTKWVNVNEEDTVKFVDTQGHSFAWEFDTSGGKAIAFSKIAPSGFVLSKDINIYVAEPPADD